MKGGYGKGITNVKDNKFFMPVLAFTRSLTACKARTP